MIVATALAKAEGEKLTKAFEEATTVHVLSTRFNEPSEEVLAAWYKQGSKVTGVHQRVRNEETASKWKTVATRTTRTARCTDPKMAASQTKLFLEEGKAGTFNALLGEWMTVVTPEPELSSSTRTSTTLP